MQTAEDLPHHIELPEEHSLTMSERVSASGYPLDLREPNPAAVSGEVSRVTRDGLLHLSMTVNPGNSGGPIIDSEGRLIGILSMRGRPERGVSGLAIAVPLRFVRAAREAVPDRPFRFESYAGDLARTVELLAALNDEMLAERSGEIAALAGRLSGHDRMIAEHQLIFAALAWNTVIAILERQRAASASQLRGEARARAEALYRRATDLARRALAEAPHVRRRFPAARLIARGRTAPFGTSRASR